MIARNIQRPRLAFRRDPLSCRSLPTELLPYANFDRFTEIEEAEHHHLHPMIIGDGEHHAIEAEEEHHLAK